MTALLSMTQTGGRQAEGRRESVCVMPCSVFFGRALYVCGAPNF